MDRPEVWTPIERYNVEQCGRDVLPRVGVFRPDDLIAGASFILAWRPRDGITAPGFCLAPFMSLGQPFPYRSDTKELRPDPEPLALLELAADMTMNGASFALLDAAFLVFPAWRGMRTRRALVAHTSDGAWNPHNPNDADDVLAAYRDDPAMFYRCIEHDRGAGLSAVELVNDFGVA